MSERQPDSVSAAQPAGVNPGYAAFQIAKALTTSEEHADPATRARAREKIARWETVLRNILSGSVEYGSRTPVEGVPGWATLEVVTGGFATGALLAGGPLQPHEQALLATLSGIGEGNERRDLNAYSLTDAGLAELGERLRTGCYDVEVPEEGALLVVAWLVEHGHAEEARELLGELSGFFARLRFYPIPLAQPRRSGARVHLRDVGSVLEQLRSIPPNPRVLAQKEAVEIWAPLHDRIVALFLETVDEEWPCRRYPDGWRERAVAVLDEYAGLRKEYHLCRKPERAGGHAAQLRAFLARCAMSPQSLTGREVSRIRHILSCYAAKRGAPDSATCAAARRRQQADVRGPMFHEIAAVIVPRLEKHAPEEGLDDLVPLQQPVSAEEAAHSGVPPGTPVPVSLQRRVERCLNETVEVLVERGLITPGDTLAAVLPQMTAEQHAAGISDPDLRRLYATVYRAFRRRRSLLLLNLEKQIHLEELPWVAAIERFRGASFTSREAARQTLEEIAVLTLTAFPHAVLPNKLLQELRALVKGAELDIPLVEEVAADIFMGRFSDKFLAAAKVAGRLLAGTLYATYYGIDYAEVVSISETHAEPKRTWFWQQTPPSVDHFAQLCSVRAGVSPGAAGVAGNGMIIEQQQILTTQNLAALFAGLALTDALRDQLGEMARQCFTWICRRQQMKTDNGHARLITLKNTAYAWRQMIFFLSLLPPHEVVAFLRWAEEHLGAQAAVFRARFRPALNGLVRAAGGGVLDTADAVSSGARRFLGWTTTRHWLLSE